MRLYRILDGEWKLLQDVHYTLKSGWVSSSTALASGTIVGETEHYCEVRTADQKYETMLALRYPNGSLK